LQWPERGIGHHHAIGSSGQEPTMFTSFKITHKVSTDHEITLEYTEIPRKTNLPNAPRSTNHTPYTLIPSLYSATPKPSIVTTSHCFRTSDTNCDSSPNCWINDDKTLCSSSPRRPQARFVCSCFGSSLQGRCTLCSLAERFF
jgi:hypothetical protein